MNQTVNRTSAVNSYQNDGFYIVSSPVVQGELIEKASSRMDAVMAGEYETGTAPMDGWKSDDPSALRKIDQAHLSDNTIFSLISHPSIGEWAAAITGADMIQLFALQLLYKPPNHGVGGHVGWHQDWQYWNTWWEGGSEVFTAWLAVSDVTTEAGPMHFARGSHKWGFLNEGNFWASEQTDTWNRERAGVHAPQGVVWEEVPAILPPGGVSFHNCLTYHGSGSNVSDRPRRAFALHLRTEKSRPLSTENNPYLQHLNNPRICPVLYQAGK